MDEKKVLIFGTFLLFGLMAVTFVELTTGGILSSPKQSQQRRPPPSQQAPQNQYRQPAPYYGNQGSQRSCGGVTNTCTVSATSRSKRCRAEEGEQLLTEKLAFPLRSETCKQAERELANRCPKGCPIDYSSIIVIGGSMDFRPLPKDEEGFCMYSGRKQVTLRATCKPQ